jgi:serine/threonine protein kinase
LRRYHDSFTSKGTLNIVMDYADGGDLNQFM